MKKFIGYIISGIGLIGMALSSSVGTKLFPSIKNSSRSLLLLSLTIVIVGIIITLIMNKSSKTTTASYSKGKEVPIYKGNEIIGYRVVE